MGVCNKVGNCFVYVIIIFAILLSIWTALVLDSEKCPEHIQPMKNLEMERYKGQWFINKRSEIDYFDLGQCTIVEYGDRTDGKKDSFHFTYKSLMGEKPD